MEEALFGLLGVLVGSAISWVKEEWHRKRSRRENGRYLAVQVIATLDEYAEKCVEVVQDNGTIMGQASRIDEQGQEYYKPVVASPSAPHFPDNLDWQSVPSNLMYRTLMLSGTARETDNYIRYSSEDAFPPYYEELFEARWKGYSKLGLKAMAIADELRDEFSLPEKEQYAWNSEWKPQEFLENKLNELEENQKKQAARQLEMLQNIGKGGSHDSD